MKRDLDRLGNGQFDVLIVGGGIYGATIARAAVLRGLRVALVEQGDFGQKTSANSLKVIHGGLRYLQHLNVWRMRESIIARRRLLQLAPHLVHPTRFLLPTYGYGINSRPVMVAALFLNDLFSWDRNRGVHPHGRIPCGRTVSRRECLDIMPGIERHRLTGGALWYDGVVSDTERLTLSFLLSADESGACLANYVRMNRYLLRDNRAFGVEVTDTLGGQTFDVEARLVVNATGPWRDDFAVSQTGDNTREFSGGWAKAVNIVIDRRLFGDYAVGIAGSQKYIDRDAVINKGTRFYIFVPWRGGTLIGTSYAVYTGSPDDCTPTSEDIVGLLDEVNKIYPAAELSISDVSFAHAGVLPMQTHGMSSNGDVMLAKHEQILDLEGITGIKGILSVTGVKYTTAIQVADRVADLLLSQLGRGHDRMLVDPPLYGADVLPADVSESAYEDTGATRAGSLALIGHLKQRYGSRYRDVLRYVQEDSSFSASVGSGRPTIAAEVVHAVRCEMAMKLTDVVLRRTGLGTRAYPGQAALRTCASIMSRELGWSGLRLNEEISAVDGLYGLYGCGRQAADG